MILGDIIYGDDTPKRDIAALDPVSLGLIEDQVAKTQTQPRQDAENINQDMKLSQDIYGGLLGPGSDQAIKSKYAGLLGENMQGFKSKASINSRFKQVDRLKSAQTAMLAKTQVENDIFAKNLEAQQMKEAARAEAISSILGFAGSVGGYAMAKQSPSVSHAPTTESSNNSSGGYRSANDGASSGMNQSMSYLESLQGMTNDRGQNA